MEAVTLQIKLLINVSFKDMKDATFELAYGAYKEIIKN